MNNCANSARGTRVKEGERKKTKKEQNNNKTLKLWERTKTRVKHTKKQATFKSKNKKNE